MFTNGFIRSEFACRCGCGFDTVDVETLYVLEEMRRWFNKPVQINSGCRCHDWNIFVGGEEGSFHLLARAGDIVVEDIAPVAVYNYFDKLYPGKYGVGKYRTFTHIDTRDGFWRQDKLK